MTPSIYLEVAVQGVLNGLVYGLMALGLSVIFGVVRVVNFAHGEFTVAAMYAVIGEGEPLARALEKLELGARRIPMDVNPAQAQAYIVNPLTGRNVQFSNLFRSHPSTADRVARLRSQEWARS